MSSDWSEAMAHAMQDTANAHTPISLEDAPTIHEKGRRAADESKGFQEAIRVQGEENDAKDQRARLATHLTHSFDGSNKDSAQYLLNAGGTKELSELLEDEKAVPDEKYAELIRCLLDRGADVFKVWRQIVQHRTRSIRIENELNKKLQQQVFEFIVHTGFNRGSSENLDKELPVYFSLHGSSIQTALFENTITNANYITTGKIYPREEHPKKAQIIIKKDSALKLCIRKITVWNRETDIVLQWDGTSGQTFITHDSDSTFELKQVGKADLNSVLDGLAKQFEEQSHPPAVPVGAAQTTPRPSLDSSLASYIATKNLQEYWIYLHVANTFNAGTFANVSIMLKNDTEHSIEFNLQHLANTHTVHELTQDYCWVGYMNVNYLPDLRRATIIVTGEQALAGPESDLCIQDLIVHATRHSNQTFRWNGYGNQKWIKTDSKEDFSLTKADVEVVKTLIQAKNIPIESVPEDLQKWPEVKVDTRPRHVGGNASAVDVMPWSRTQGTKQQSSSNHRKPFDTVNSSSSSSPNGKDVASTAERDIFAGTDYKPVDQTHQHSKINSRPEPSKRSEARYVPYSRPGRRDFEWYRNKFKTVDTSGRLGGITI